MANALFLDTALFYYTLILLLMIVLTAAVCLSSYLVSRKMGALYAAIGFLVYFFDVALVFQDDFIAQNLLSNAASYYMIGNPIASIVTGVGLITLFWLVVCEFFGDAPGVRTVVPGAFLAVGSIVVLVAFPENNLREFLFYSMREIALFAMLVYAALRVLISRDDAQRNHALRYRGRYLAFWVFGVLVVVENVFFLLVYDPATPSAALPFLPERNFAENLFALVCALFACHDAFRTLALRFEQPPISEGVPQQQFIDSNLPLYAKRYRLSAREGEVLRYVLAGKDNQNIASSMQLALSTVKVYVHKILQKTGQANRQDLIRDFWKNG